jgi:hypothetical protein
MQSPVLQGVYYVYGVIILFLAARFNNPVRVSHTANCLIVVHVLMPQLLNALNGGTAIAKPESSFIF